MWKHTPVKLQECAKIRNSRLSAIHVQFIVHFYSSKYSNISKWITTVSPKPSCHCFYLTTATSHRSALVMHFWQWIINRLPGVPPCDACCFQLLMHFSAYLLHHFPQDGMSLCALTKCGAYSRLNKYMHCQKQNTLNVCKDGSWNSILSQTKHTAKRCLNNSTWQPNFVEMPHKHSPMHNKKSICNVRSRQQWKVNQ